MSPVNPIVVGIDFSPASANVLRHAATTAASPGAELLAEHVVDSSRVAAWRKSHPDAGKPEQLLEVARGKLREMIAAELRQGGGLH